MHPMNAEQIHAQKIQTARSALEEPGGNKIKPDKIQEWALLDISETLRAINFQLMRMQVPH
jgi:hypothetical protein